MHKVAAMVSPRDGWSWDWFDNVFAAMGGTAEAPRSSYELVRGDEKDLIRVDVPGCGPEDVDVELSGSVLLVRWNGRTGKALLKFKVAQHVRAEAVEATVEKGVLSVRLPKAPSEGKPEKVRVR